MPSQPATTADDLVSDTSGAPTANTLRTPSSVPTSGLIKARERGMSGGHLLVALAHCQRVSRLERSSVQDVELVVATGSGDDR